MLVENVQYFYRECVEPSTPLFIRWYLIKIGLVMMSLTLSSLPFQAFQDDSKYCSVLTSSNLLVLLIFTQICGYDVRLTISCSGIRSLKYQKRMMSDKTKKRNVGTFKGKNGNDSREPRENSPEQRYITPGVIISGKTFAVAVPRCGMPAKIQRWR
jgi:hypothetical protein